MVANTPDKITVGEFARDSDEAFRAIYRHFNQRLYYFALRFVPGADAKDIVSEAFVKLWEKRKGFNDLPSIQQYLFILVRNACYTLLRREAMKLHKEAEILHELKEASEEDLDIEDIRQELIRQVYTEVGRLPEALQRVFLLSFEQGLKPGEIAEKLNVSVQTVRNQKVTALKLLRAALGERASLLSLILLLASKA